MEVLIDSKQDFFANIPPEIMINILSRLPIPTVISCKCVCKSWLNLVKSLELAKSHFSKSVPVPGLALDEGRPLTLALFRGKKSSKPYEVLELVDTQNYGHHLNVVFKFNFPHPELLVYSSADGLLLLLSKGIPILFICNPITREYIKLPPPNPKEAVSDAENAFGFGVSKLAGKYKVVRISHEYVFNGQYSGAPSPCKCEVYTLGKGSWRSVAGSPLWYSEFCLDVFLNGNVHWLVQGLEEGSSKSLYH